MKKNNRIKSIDILRGIVIIIMALDHVRDYFHYDAYFFDPNDVEQTTLALFGTRFITHFCAPVFVFLAGTSAFFVGQRKTPKELSSWLLKRGFWLLFVEFVIVKLAWNFKLDYSVVLLQVIWILGLSMIFLAGFIHLPKKLMIATSLLMIIGHNLFDSYTPTGEEAGVFWNFLHVFSMNEFDGFTVFVGYPIIPWIFVMPLGYYLGGLYLPDSSAEQRKKVLLRMGLGCIALFFLLRSINVYGDPGAWIHYDEWSKSLMSFFNITKYPPSLIYLLITLGPSLVFLAYAEKWQSKWTERLLVFGRVPMFFYIIHIYIIHLLALFAAMATGFNASDMVIDVWITLEPALQGYGFSLWIVYGIWVLVILGLYPICKKYDIYKRNNRDKWWLSYL